MSAATVFVFDSQYEMFQILVPLNDRLSKVVKEAKCFADLGLSREQAAALKHGVKLPCIPHKLEGTNARCRAEINTLLRMRQFGGSARTGF